MRKKLDSLRCDNNMAAVSFVEYRYGRHDAVVKTLSDKCHEINLVMQRTRRSLKLSETGVGAIFNVAIIL